MWPHHANMEREKMNETCLLCVTCKKRDGRPDVGGVSIERRNGAPSRKRCVVNRCLY